MDKLEALKSIFGHDSFREGQEALIDALMGGRDAVGVMPTGAGKSICYQLPAMLKPGVTLVISPLISLMKDQVMALKASGVPAAYLNSSLTSWQQGEAIRRASRGAYRVIYVAPERLDVDMFVDYAMNADISLVAVDEAHCVSQWGQDFRPSYLRIADFVDRLPTRPPVGAFTATATRAVKEDIVRMLRLRSPMLVTTGFNRPNLRFACVKPSNKFVYLCEYLAGLRDECGIIYCSTRKNVDEVAGKLRLQGYSATRYHAGLDDSVRKQNQDDFQFDRANIMVATNAFGMGIDKSNVRFVIHYNMPMNLESYYQEAGRAGRDGEPADCLLLYSGQDVITAKWLIEHSDANDELTEKQRGELHGRDMERLKQMTYYATLKSCLRRFILRYFGEYDAPNSCGNCSVCNGDVFEVDNGRTAREGSITRQSISREERRIEKEHRAAVRHGFEENLTTLEAALLDNLKTLRSLIAAQRHAPAYTVFSDATLHDMIKKRPMNDEDFMNVSGVGKAKQALYCKAFLAVIRDGTEPNEALALTQAPKRGAPWTQAEEDMLRSEYSDEPDIGSISVKHRRSVGSIRARLRKLGLTE